MYDRLLVRPSVFQLGEALLAAQAGPHRRERADWERELGALKGEREGRRAWAGVGLAWWTDARDARHFRVVGGGEPFAGPERPAFADVYPAVCVRRAINGRKEWVALCGCGAVAPAAAPVGWSGPRCPACEVSGPSTGRILDLGPARAGLPWAGGFVVVRRGREVAVCDWEGTQLREFQGVRVGGTAAVTPDGRHLISINDEGRLRVHELAGGTLVTEQRTKPASAIRFSPLGSMVAITYVDGVRVYDFDSEVGGLHARPSLHDALGLAWSVQGRMAVAGKNGLRVMDERDEEMPLFEAEVESNKNVLDRVKRYPLGVSRPSVFRFTPDGNGLCALRRFGTGNYVAVSRWDWDGEWWRRRPDVPFCAAAHAEFSPDGRRVAAVRSLVEVIDVQAGRALGSVGWRATEEAAFPPDGRLLIRDADSLRVVPWSLLLGVTSPA